MCKDLYIMALEIGICIDKQLISFGRRSGRCRCRSYHTSADRFDCSGTIPPARCQVYRCITMCMNEARLFPCCRVTPMQKARLHQVAVSSH